MLIVIFEVSKPVKLSDLLKPADLQEALNSCAVCDVYFYVCTALNDSKKTCGALRTLKILRNSRTH